MFILHMQLSSKSICTLESDAHDAIMKFLTLLAGSRPHEPSKNKFISTLREHVPADHHVLPKSGCCYYRDTNTQQSLWSGYNMYRDSLFESIPHETRPVSTLL